MSTDIGPFPKDRAEIDELVHRMFVVLLADQTCICPYLTQKGLFLGFKLDHKY